MLVDFRLTLSIGDSNSLTLYGNKSAWKYVENKGCFIVSSNYHFNCFISFCKQMDRCIVFALTNSFVEESITRLGVVVVLKNKLKERTIPLVSAFIFGIVHYWGNPRGIIGVIVSGFLGWFLTKSILETKGIFWAWFIHFLQDVIIFSALFSFSYPR